MEMYHLTYTIYNTLCVLRIRLMNVKYLLRSRVCGEGGGQVTLV